MRGSNCISRLGLAGLAIAVLALSAPAAQAEGRPVRSASGSHVPLAEGSGSPPASAPAPTAAPVEVIFTGFARRVDKGASVFVRMTGEVPVAVERAGRRIVYHLAGAKLGVKNNANPLPTSGFGPPVSNVALVPGAGVVDLVIELSEDPGDQAPSHRFVAQSRLATLVVELPPALEPPAPPPRD